MPLAAAAARVYSSLQATVWGCVSTIFLCTWAAYHPDVPGPDGGRWGTTVERVFGAISALLSPEAVLMRALTDWVFSRRALKTLKETGRGLKWTQMHASLAYMGGFRLKNPDDTNGEILYKYKFFEYVIEGEIEMPNTEVEEIRDKSKIDFLGKLIVLLHISWFIIKFVFGPLSKSPMIPLGSFTLSLVLINSFCYAFWWNKPTNVSVPFPVFQRKKEQGSVQRGEAPGDHPVGPPVEKSNERSSSKKGFWFNARTAFLKGTLLLFLTIIGATLGAVNFCVSAIVEFQSDTKTILWFVSSGIICLCSISLYLFFFWVTIFMEHFKLPDSRNFWRFVVMMSVIISCARLCLLVIAILELRLLKLM